MDYKSVKISEDAKIARQSVVIGDVTIGRDSCVLHYAVIRGDDAPIVIGEESNVQENCTIHVSRNMPVHIGNNVTVGHNAVLHGCMIGDRTLIGMGAVVLDGARIGKDCIIGAGSLVTKNTVIPDGSLVMGSPAKIKRNLTWEEKLGNLENSKEYVSVSAEMQKQGVLGSSSLQSATDCLHEEVPKCRSTVYCKNQTIKISPELYVKTVEFRGYLCISDSNLKPVFFFKIYYCAVICISAFRKNDHGMEYFIV